MCIPVHLLSRMHLWWGQGKPFLLTDVFVLYFSVVIQEEIKSRLKLGNACYYSVQNFLSSSLLSKSLKIKIYMWADHLIPGLNFFPGNCNM